MSQRTGDRKAATVEMPVEIPADDARAGLGDLLDRAGFRGEHIVITRHGKPLAALVSMPDLERLRALDAA